MGSGSPDVIGRALETPDGKLKKTGRAMRLHVLSAAAAIGVLGGPASPSLPPPPSSPPYTTRCGTTWEDANRYCYTPCPGGTDGECRSNSGSAHKCFSSLTGCSADDYTSPPPPASPSLDARGAGRGVKILGRKRERPVPPEGGEGGLDDTPIFGMWSSWSRLPSPPPRPPPREAVHTPTRGARDERCRRRCREREPIVCPKCLK